MDLSFSSKINKSINKYIKCFLLFFSWEAVYMKLKGKEYQDMRIEIPVFSPFQSFRFLFVG